MKDHVIIKWPTDVQRGVLVTFKGVFMFFTSYCASSFIIKPLRYILEVSFVLRCSLFLQLAFK